MSGPLVSIVTPVYNGGAFFRECVDSVLGQTHRNLRYVIVNNASEDDTLQIAEEYAARDPRVSVVTNDTLLPPVQNHNKAMSLVTPDAAYCKSLMADDWLYPDAVERMVAVAAAHPTVGVVCGFGFNGRRVLYEGWPYPAECVPARDICRATLRRALYVFGSSTTQLFRADLVRKRTPLLVEDTLHEDMEVCFDLLRESDFAFVHQVVAFVREHEGSLSAEIDALGTVEAANLAFLKKYGPAFFDADELAAEWERALGNYYAYLARKGWKAEAEFWDVHRRNLEALGAPLSMTRLVGASALELARWTTNSDRWIHTLRAVRHRLAGRSKTLREDVAAGLRGTKRPR